MAAGNRLSEREIKVVMGGLMAGLLLAALDQTIVATALPTIVGDLGGLEQLSWVVTAYLLTSTASLPLYGKVSDLYGRRAVFQAAIVVFLAGSVLAGMAGSMVQLILARGLQGVGGGGLIALSMTIVGDVIAPRERGRYQGYIGAVWAFASVMGPLAGGFLTDRLTWRWVFFVNVPVGLAALVVTTGALRVPFVRRPHRIDLPGAALLVAGAVCVLLVSVWGGTTYPWSSPVIASLAGGAVVLLGAFLWWERRAAEPILPLELFGVRSFAVASAASFVVGASLFGVLVFLPLYLQTVQGESATGSGLLLVPMMLGIVVASVAAGRAISRTGRYRAFPVAGMAIAGVGTFLLSRLTARAGPFDASFGMFVVGTGIGLTMQVLVLAVQNAVRHRHLGSATSAVTFFRSIGGTLGVAAYGALFAAALQARLGRILPGGAGVRPGALVDSPAAIRALPAPVRAAVAEAIAASLRTVFLAAIPLVLAGLVLVLALPQVPLRETAHVGPTGAVEGLEEAS